MSQYCNLTIWVFREEKSHSNSDCDVIGGFLSDALSADFHIFHQSHCETSFGIELKEKSLRPNMLITGRH